MAVKHSYVAIEVYKNFRHCSSLVVRLKVSKVMEAAIPVRTSQSCLRCHRQAYEIVEKI